MKKVLGTITLVAFTLFWSLISVANTEKAESSKINGVQLGTITYSFRDMPNQSLERILDYAVASGVSSVELMGYTVEEYFGAPTSEKDRAEGRLRAWRANFSMDRAKEVGEMFENRGVGIHILKIGERNWSDEEINYAFEMCKAFGAKGISTEVNEKTAARFACFADRHEKYVIFHNHDQAKDPAFSYEKILSYSKYYRLNFDMGHYYGATGINPCQFIKRMHDRIVSIHVKDKTGKFHIKPDVNHPFGEGGTPVVEVLQLIRDNQYPIYCDIELEYPIPNNSNNVKEVRKCVEYCKKALRLD